MASKKPVIEKVSNISSSKLFTIEQVDLLFSNGEKRQYERVKGNQRPAVFVVAINDENELILIKEYLVGVDHYELGLVKGLMDEGEFPIEAANRELMEEAGFGASDLKEICTMSVSPGYLASRFTVVLARGLYRKRLPGDEPEPLEVVKWPLKKIDELINRDDVTDARTIAALLRISKTYERREYV
jgi:ADP-ribose diphosphatase